MSQLKAELGNLQKESHVLYKLEAAQKADISSLTASLKSLMHEWRVRDEEKESYISQLISELADLEELRNKFRRLCKADAAKSKEIGELKEILDNLKQESSAHQAASKLNISQLEGMMEKLRQESHKHEAEKRLEIDKLKVKFGEFAFLHSETQLVASKAKGSGLESQLADLQACFDQLVKDHAAAVLQASILPPPRRKKKKKALPPPLPLDQPQQLDLQQQLHQAGPSTPSPDPRHHGHLPPIKHAQQQHDMVHPFACPDGEQPSLSCLSGGPSPLSHNEDPAGEWGAVASHASLPEQPQQDSQPSSSQPPLGVWAAIEHAPLSDEASLRFGSEIEAEINNSAKPMSQPEVQKCCCRRSSTKCMPLAFWCFGGCRSSKVQPLMKRM